VAEKLDMSWQCVLAAQKASCILGCHQENRGQQVREVILPLCSSLVRPHLESCVQLWSTHRRKNLLEQVQKRPQRRSERQNTSPVRTGQESWGCPAGEEKAEGRPDCSLSILKGDNLFCKACCDGTSSNGFALKEGRFRLDIRKNFFTMKVLKH